MSEGTSATTLDRDRVHVVAEPPPAPGDGPRRRRTWVRWVPLAVVLAFAASWELAARLELVSPLFFPPPSETARTLVRLFAEGTLVGDLVATLSRLGRGLLLGAGLGLLVGLLLGWSRGLHDAFDPLVALVHPIPKIALLPLFLIVFGLGDLATVVLVGAVAFFPMAINTMTGVREINPVHFEVAASYGAGRGKVLRRVVLPGSLPMVLAGLRLALNTALMVTIAVELIMSSEGLGARVWFAWETLRTEELYAAIAVVAVIGIVFNALLHALDRRLAPWRQPRPR